MRDKFEYFSGELEIMKIEVTYLENNSIEILKWKYIITELKTK